MGPTAAARTSAPSLHTQRTSALPVRLVVPNRLFRRVARNEEADERHLEPVDLELGGDEEAAGQFAKCRVKLPRFVEEAVHAHRRSSLWTSSIEQH